MTGIFECEVEGVRRSDISKFAKAYGVYIADRYGDETSKSSFRIAFHPYMSNDSIKLLGYVLKNVENEC